MLVTAPAAKSLDRLPNDLSPVLSGPETSPKAIAPVVSPGRLLISSPIVPDVDLVVCPSDRTVSLATVPDMVTPSTTRPLPVMPVPEPSDPNRPRWLKLPREPHIGLSAASSRQDFEISDLMAAPTLARSAQAVTTLPLGSVPMSAE